MTSKNIIGIIFLSLLALFLAVVLIRLGKEESKKSIDSALNQQAAELLKDCAHLNDEQQKVMNSFVAQNKTILQEVRTLFSPDFGKDTDNLSDEQFRQRFFDMFKSVAERKNQLLKEISPELYKSRANYVFAIPGSNLVAKIAGDTNIFAYMAVACGLLEQLNGNKGGLTKKEIKQILATSKTTPCYQAISRITRNIALSAAINNKELLNVTIPQVYAISYTPDAPSTEVYDDTYLIAEEKLDLSNAWVLKLDFKDATAKNPLYSISQKTLETLLNAIKIGSLWALDGNIFFDKNNEHIYLVDLEGKNRQTAQEALGLDSRQDRICALVGFKDLLECFIKGQSWAQASVVVNYLKNLPEDYKKEGFYTGAIVPLFDKIPRKVAELNYSSNPFILKSYSHFYRDY